MYSFTFGLNKEEIDDSSLKEVPEDEKYIAKKCFFSTCLYAACEWSGTHNQYLMLFKATGAA